MINTYLGSLPRVHVHRVTYIWRLSVARPLVRRQAEYSRDDYSGGESRRRDGFAKVEGIRQAPQKYTVGEGGTGGGGEGYVYATRRWAPKGKRARGWYKLYRSIDLLSEETLRCHYYCEETHAAVAAVAIATPLPLPLLLLLLLVVLLLLCGLLGCI